MDTACPLKPLSFTSIELRLKRNLEDGDQQADQVITVASGLNEPNGVAFYEDALFVAEINRILRYDNTEADLQNVAAPVVINQEYPAESWHGWKYLRFGPDGSLLVSDDTGNAIYRISYQAPS